MTLKAALVAGASRGLGAKVVEELTRHEWDVIGTSRSIPDWRFPEHASWIQHDIGSTDHEPVSRAIGHRRLDALVINAMQGGPKGGISSVEPTAIMDSLNVAVVGATRLVKACLPALRRSQFPTIAIISSRLGSISAQANGAFEDFDTSYAYRISKAAQNMLVVSLSQEFQGAIRCLAVHPGTLSTSRGRPGANKSPKTAAMQLRERLEETDRKSPQFISLDGNDLDW